MPMRKSRFTEEQIAHALRQAETGTRSLKYAERWASANRPTIAGRRAMADRGARDPRRILRILSVM
jgi:hypothetical protein